MNNNICVSICLNYEQSFILSYFMIITDSKQYFLTLAYIVTSDLWSRSNRYNQMCVSERHQGWQVSPVHGKNHGKNPVITDTAEILSPMGRKGEMGET